LIIAGDISWLQAVVLGLLQGLTEFLPVSSTAHIALASRLMYGADAGAAFSAVVQLGPIVAILLYFRSDLIRYVQGMMRTGSPGKAITTDDTDAKLGWFTLFGTVPLAVAGLLLEHKVDTSFRKPSVMGIFLILLALIMLAAERYGKRNRDLEQITFADSQKIGWAQALALVPGASRSGVTITAGMFLGLDRESATRFSFLLSIPAITAAGLYKLIKVMKHTGLGGEAPAYVFAAIVAGAVAYIVIKWFLGYMKQHNTNLFIVYRIALGVLLLGLVATHKISNAPPAPEPAKEIITQSHKVNKCPEYIATKSAKGTELEQQADRWSTYFQSETVLGGSLRERTTTRYFASHHKYRGSIPPASYPLNLVYLV